VALPLPEYRLTHADDADADAALIRRKPDESAFLLERAEVLLVLTTELPEICTNRPHEGRVPAHSATNFSIPLRNICHSSNTGYAPPSPTGNLTQRRIPEDVAVKGMRKSTVASVAKATHLTANQVRNARTIVGVVVAQKLPQRAAVIAVATALQESKLRNEHYGDRDSLGLFQQRPSMGWGTNAQVLNPRHATRRFLDALQRVPDWRALPVTKAAQDVQRSAFPNAYAHWAPLAKELVKALLPKPDAAKTTPAPADQSVTQPSGCIPQSRKRRSS
jgi:hypothetical protein